MGRVGQPLSNGVLHGGGAGKRVHEGSVTARLLGAGLRVGLLAVAKGTIARRATTFSLAILHRSR
jgi:hypothetical protein